MYVWPDKLCSSPGLQAMSEAHWRLAHNSCTHIHAVLGLQLAQNLADTLTSMH
jgi:hypothetical protein